MKTCFSVEGYLGVVFHGNEIVLIYLSKTEIEHLIQRCYN